MESNDQASAPESGASPPGAPGAAPHTPSVTPPPAAAASSADDSPGSGATPPSTTPSSAGPPPGATPPPPGATPPPFGTTPPGATPPPFGPPAPQSGPRALVRTQDPKIIAGVCGGLARATNTDPLLYRVILAVLVFFGGIGILLYLLAWLLLPMEGDSASPIEALLGRGKSSTPPVVTVLLGVGAVLTLALSLNTGFENVALLAVVLVGLVLLLRRTGQVSENFGTGARPAAAGPATYPPPTPAGYPAPGGPYEAMPTQVAPTQSMPATGAPATTAPTPPYTPSGATPPYTPAHTPTPPYPAATYPAGTYPATAGPTATLPVASSGTPSAPPYTPPTSGAGPYSSPFAPHGPYAPRPPVPPGPVLPIAPRPPKEKSILGRLTFAVMCLALAGLAVADLAGANVPFSGYAATALGITALGLLVGAWFGRARLLIVLGVILSLVLGVGYGGEKVGDYTNVDRVVMWTPTSVDALPTEYKLESGRATLDLNAIDFTDRSRDLSLRLGAGDLVIDLPPNVDVKVDARVGAGDARIFGARSDGLGINRVASDNGFDGAGGGTLNLNVELGVGSLEVTR